MTWLTGLSDVYGWTLQNHCWQYFTTYGEELTTSLYNMSSSWINQTREQHWTKSSTWRWGSTFQGKCRKVKQIMLTTNCESRETITWYLCMTVSTETPSQTAQPDNLTKKKNRTAGTRCREVKQLPSEHWLIVGGRQKRTMAMSDAVE